MTKKTFGYKSNGTDKSMKAKPRTAFTAMQNLLVETCKSNTILKVQQWFLDPQRGFQERYRLRLENFTKQAPLNQAIDLAEYLNKNTTALIPNVYWHHRQNQGVEDAIGDYFLILGGPLGFSTDKKIPIGITSHLIRFDWCEENPPDAVRITIPDKSDEQNLTTDYFCKELTLTMFNSVFSDTL